MRGVVMVAPGEVRVEEREDPRIVEPTDAVIRVTATCICGSDLWPYRGVEPVDHQPMGHEYVGIVEQIGDDVETLEPGDFVVGSFVILDNTCEICQAGYQSLCVNREFVAQTIGTQSDKARIPCADGTLVVTPGEPDSDLIPSLLATSDVLGTGWFAGVHLHGGPAPVRRFLPEPIQLVWDRSIDPGKVFDLALPMEQAAEGYKAMDERRAIKVQLDL